MNLLNNHLKVLIIGGTRLLGLSLVKKMVDAGYDVTVLSRRHDRRVKGVTYVVAEKHDGMLTISHINFDFVIDFLSYDASSVKDVLRYTKNAVYFFVSSVWLGRLGVNKDANAWVEHIEGGKLLKFLPVTQNYLIGKHEAEKAIRELHEIGRNVIILRLPIFWGRYEHTGRVNFYAERINDGEPLILVNEGSNLTQIAWVEDLSEAILNNLKLMISSEKLIWEGLPHSGLSVRSVIESIALGLRKKPKLIEVPESTLAKKIPDYLKVEPLVRECALKISDSNLFSATGMVPTEQEIWLAECASEQNAVCEYNTRKEEIEFLEEQVRAEPSL